MLFRNTSLVKSDISSQTRPQRVIRSPKGIVLLVEAKMGDCEPQNAGTQNGQESINTWS